MLAADIWAGFRAGIELVLQTPSYSNQRAAFTLLNNLQPEIAKLKIRFFLCRSSQPLWNHLAWTLWGWISGGSAGFQHIPLSLEWPRSEWCAASTVLPLHTLKICVHPAGKALSPAQRLLRTHFWDILSELSVSEATSDIWSLFADFWRTKLTPELVTGGVTWEGFVAQVWEKWFYLRNLHMKGLNFTSFAGHFSSRMAFDGRNPPSDQCPFFFFFLLQWHFRWNGISPQSRVYWQNKPVENIAITSQLSQLPLSL